jgi:hypothetical protein
MTQFPTYMHSIRKLSHDEMWLQSELRRIGPNCLNEGNEAARMRALELLALKMRNERDAPAVPQEPVAIIRCWTTPNGEGQSQLFEWCDPGIEAIADGEYKLYAAPQPQPRLTDAEILTLWAQTYVERGASGIEFARDIEKKVRGEA